MNANKVGKDCEWDYSELGTHFFKDNVQLLSFLLVSYGT